MKNVPKLRFKGFSDEWKEKKLGDIADITKLAGFEFTEYVQYSDNGNIIAIRGLNVKNGKLNLKDVKYIDNSDFSKLERSKLYKNDLLFTYVGTIGDVALVDVDDKYYLAPNVCRIRVDKHNSYLIKTLMSSSKFNKKIILPNITTSSQPALSMENIRLFNIKIPSLEEQEKIANFLSKIDKLVEKQEEKVNNLEQYKKGMMQKIFSQEIRFKKEDGGEYPEWEKGKLKKYVNDFIVPMRDKPKVFDGNIPWCRIEDLEGKYLNDTLSGQYVSLEVIKEMNLKVFPKGTLICSCSAKLGVCALTTQNLITNQTFIGLVPGSEVVGEFLYYRMLTYTKKLNSLSSGTTIAYLSRQEFEEFPVKIPCLEEQTKIANFLSKIDSIVEKEKEKLEELRQWKKGLLQRMFV